MQKPRRMGFFLKDQDSRMREEKMKNLEGNKNYERGDFFAKKGDFKEERESDKTTEMESKMCSFC